MSEMVTRSATHGLDVQPILRDLIAEANSLVILARAHGRGSLPDGLISAQRHVLRELAHGPRTVPDLARQRTTSRQNIQIIVNRLVTMGLVETVVNPRHRRSRLIRLLPAGEQFLTSQAQLPSDLPFDDARVEAGQVLAALRTLQSLRKLWSGAVNGEGTERRVNQNLLAARVVAAAPNALEAVGEELPLNLL